MGTLVHDLRYACRQLARAPGFTVVAVLTLALGIGANTAIFGAVDAVLLEPLPYADADRIVTLWRHDRNAGIERDDVSPADFLDWRERSGSFDALAAADPFTMDYLGPDGPERFPTWRVTEGFFRVFGIDALIGRTLGAEDHRPGSTPVVVLSHALWRSRFGADADVVGRTLTLDGRGTTIVGVMPPRFGFPPGRDLWVPRPFEGGEAQNRSAAFWQVVGKLAAGVEVAAAQAELDAIASQLATEHPATNADIGVSVVPLAEHLVGGIRPALLLFLGAVGLVLLIACVNVANLMLARGASRRRELAIRSVLGADRGRLIRQLVTESLVLAALGGLVGLLIALSSFGALDALRPPELPHVEPPAVGVRVLLFVCALSLGAALLAGLAPAWLAARSDLRDRLQAGARATPAGARRFRATLIASELALAMVLLVGAGLLVRSFVALLDVERGYRTENVLALTVQAWDYYPEPAQRAAFVRQALGRITALPGVVAAGVTSSLPLAPEIGADTAAFTVEGRGRAGPAAPSGDPAARTAIVTEGYFSALGIPLRTGRLFADRDDADAPPVVLVNETMARRYWPGEDPLGARITFDFSGYSPRTTAEVVGVVADVRNRLDVAPRPSLFLPHAQHPIGALHFTVRNAGDPEALLRAVRTEIWAMSPTMPIAAVATLDGLLADSLRERRVTLGLLLAFSIAALGLAAVGTYGVLSYESSRRSQEIGIRVALGAPRERVLGLVIGEGLKVAALGVALGAILALAATRLLARFLFDVEPFDPTTFAAVALLLLIVAGAASFVPARRAACADPMTALRAD